MSTTSSGLISMRYSTVGAGKMALGGAPGVTLRTSTEARGGGASIGAVGETMGTLRDKEGELKGVGNAQSKVVARC